MAIMCEVCKCSIYLEKQLDGSMEYGGCESGCSCCSGEGMKALNESLEKHTAQLLALTNEQREAGDDSNPILHAEGGPNRFAIMSLFFNDSEGVRIQEDLDLNAVTVNYFTEGEEIELQEGALYEWAINYYRENY